MKTHCPRGHKYTEENTRWERTAKGSPSRKCRACDRIKSQKLRDKRKAERNEQDNTSQEGQP